jgi:hypothetical protein
MLSNVRRNRSHSTDYHGNSHDNVSKQNLFSFRGHHLARTLAWSSSTRNFLFGYVESKKSEMRPGNVYYVKNRKFWGVFNVSKEMLKCIMTSCPSQLQE